MYDILIKNGTIIDGTKKATFEADVAIKGDTIVAIGKNLRQKTIRVIDAAGQYVVPGFIDITNHSDTHWTLFSIPSQESLVRQGITTILGGTCGTSLAPLVKSEHIKSIHKWAGITGININWLTLAEFYEELRRHESGVNFATLVGHGTIRRDVLGDSIRPPDKSELKEMVFLLDQALREGALGISYGLTFSHGRSAKDAELIELARLVAARHGFASLHLRDEGKGLLPSISEAIRIVRESGISLEIAHVKALGKEAWDDFPKALKLIQRAREEGCDITLDIFPYTKTGSLLYALLPAWARDGGKDAIMKRLKDPQQSRLMLDDLERATFHYDYITIASAKREKSLAGRTLASIAASMEIPPAKALLQILAWNDLAVTIFGETIQDSAIEELIKEPYSMVASDSYGLDSEAREGGDLAHPRSFGATARFLGEYVRNRGVVSWEEGIYKLTGAPAIRMGLKNRGILAPKHAADVVIFDPDALRDNATFENPFQYPSGISWVIVNGELVVEQETYTGKKPGRILVKS